MLHDVWKNEVDNMSDVDDSPLQLDDSVSIKRPTKRTSMLADMIRSSLVQEDLLLDDEDDGEKRAQDFYNILHGLDQSMRKDIEASSQGTMHKSATGDKPSSLQVTVLSTKDGTNNERDGDVKTTNKKTESLSIKDDPVIVDCVVTPEHPFCKKPDSESKNDTKTDQKDKKVKRKQLPPAHVPRTLKDDVRDLCITSASSRGISFREPPTEPAQSSRERKKASLRNVSTSSRRSSLSKSSVCLTASVAEDARSSLEDSSSVVSALTDSEHRSSIKVVARRRSIEELATPVRRGSMASLEPISPSTSRPVTAPIDTSGVGELREIPPGFEDQSEDEEEFGLEIPRTRRHSSMKPRPATPSLSNLLPKCSPERRLFYGPISMSTRGTVKFRRGKLKLKDSRFTTPVTSLKAYVRANPKLATSASLHTAHRESVQTRLPHFADFTPSSGSRPLTSASGRRPVPTRRPITR